MQEVPLSSNFKKKTVVVFVSFFLLYSILLSHSLTDSLSHISTISVLLSLALILTLTTLTQILNLYGIRLSLSVNQRLVLIGPTLLISLS